MASIAASGIVLEPLTKDNYDNWSCLVRNYLMGQYLWDVVLASHPAIDTELTRNRMNKKAKKEVEIWKMKNAKALHIIQLACGSENLTHIRDCHTAKQAWFHFSAVYGSELKADPDIEQGVVDDSLLHYKLLHKYIESGEWNDAKAFMNRNETSMFSTSSMGRTVLHVAVIAGHEFIVRKLVKEGKDMLVKMKDNRGYTALALVAELTGNTDIAKCMIENKKGKIIGQDLLSMKTNDGEIPVLLAAAKGHREMVRYLYPRTRVEDLADENYHNGVLLVTRCLTAEMFDVALSLLQQSSQMPIAHKSTYESDGVQPLYAMACMPYVFPSGSYYGFIQQFLYKILRLPERKEQNFYGITIIETSVALQDNQVKTSFAGRIFGWLVSQVQFLGRILIHIYMSFQNLVLLKSSGIREIYNQKTTHRLVLDILNCLYRKIEGLNESELREASAYDAMIQAAKHGIIEFIDAMRKANPDLLWAIDKDRRGIFSHAILNRRKEVFQLVHDATVNGRKEIVRCRVDAFDNTLLHLAGNLGPSSGHRISGPALQIQREIMWFQSVEKIVHPKCKDAENLEGKKPREIFNESHKELLKAGEKWAKEAAGSFALVATLITTIMFAAAFTVPGGNNQDSGVPLFLQNKIFNVFIIADAISLFTSSTSVLLFIGILTGRYAEKDFLKSLPLKLLFALIMLFISVVSMMVVFCASLAMLLKGHQGVIITAMSFASIPVIVLVPSQFGLFIEVYMSTSFAN